MYKKKFNYWMGNINKDDKNELMGIVDDEKEIKERFYKNLEFGTGGLRGIIGIGSNRINKYTVSKATQGVANYIINILKVQNASVVIGYDTRYKSKEFAKETALVFVANDIKVYLFKEARPVPELSYAVRKLEATMGVVITASHNPAIYNGYKVYNCDGYQINPESANQIISEIDDLDIFNDVKTVSEEETIENNKFEMILENIESDFLDYIYSKKINDSIENSDINVLYSPLHGTGKILVPKILKRRGIRKLDVVKEQMEEDTKFSTVKVPNPEERESYLLALEQAKYSDYDLILATDPDCDRVGVMVKDDNDEYINLTGNQIGALLIEYILSTKKNLPKNGIILNTIVTSTIGEKIAKEYGIDCFSTLTGFKYIGEKITEFDSTKDEFVFGYEESFGYLYGTEVRDKDGVISSMLIVEMAAFYKNKGFSLYQEIEKIYSKYGYYSDGLESFKFDGIEGDKNMKRIMKTFREKEVKKISTYLVEKRIDYLNDNTGLRKENVIKYFIENDSWIALRPSGTEPKLKIYFSIKDKDKIKSNKKFNDIKNYIIELIKLASV